MDSISVLLRNKQFNNMWVRFTDFLSRHAEKIVLILAITFSIGSFVYYYQAGLSNAFGDGRAHLNIARRVIDNINPGLAQVGGYWLPLLHILMLPTIWHDFMWQSGLSGSIPNMIAFVIAVVLMFRLVLYITKDKLSAFVGASVLLLNPNLLYMQAAPMTESLFVMTIVGFMYFFYRWFREKQISDLIFAALFLILASLNRYEGWGLVIAANVLMVWYWVQTKFDRKVEGALFAFASLSFLGIFLWIMWGMVIFHDPLEFMHNSLSAGNQTSLFDEWTGVHNVHDAALANIYAIFHISGVLLFFVSILGLAVYLTRGWRESFKSEHLILLLLAVPFLFDTLTLFLGMVPVEVPELSKIAPPGNYFNIRYAIFSVPFLALFTAVISKMRLALALFFALIIVNYWFVYHHEGHIAALMDAGAVSVFDTSVPEAMIWFRNHYNGGLILSSTVNIDGQLYRLSLDQKNYINEGSFKYWIDSLEDPAKYASWIFYSKIDPREPLLKKINKEALKNDFTVEYEDNYFVVLSRNKK